MYKQLINTANGEFTINNYFIVSNKTTLNELLLHFGKDQLLESTFISNCYYTSSQIEIDNLFFKFIFYLENDLVKKIGFEIETENKIREPWGNNKVLETAWVANQMSDSNIFDWDNNPEQKQYGFIFDWGGVSVFFDFKNGTYESSLYYDSKK